MADNKLSRMASELLAISLQTMHDYDEMEMRHAPSECGALIAKSCDKRRQEVVKRYGFADVDEAADAIAERLSPKSAHELCSVLL